MGTRNTQNTATGTGRVNSGSGHLAETGSVLLGNNATLNTTSTVKAVDLAGAKVEGTVTVGEIGLGAQALDAFKSLFQSQQQQTTDLLSALTPGAVAAAPATTDTPASSTPAATDPLSPEAKQKLKSGVLLLIGLAAAWWLWKKLF